ncbi:MAG: VanW family protein [Bifidobacteriaceae bacterium]|jgi:vancomycin resistance protein YoaR|nr:VanW family protein [Bifidobacteriaceae bacterium]
MSAIDPSDAEPPRDPAAPDHDPWEDDEAVLRPRAAHPAVPRPSRPAAAGPRRAGPSRPLVVDQSGSPAPPRRSIRTGAPKPVDDAERNHPAGSVADGAVPGRPAPPRRSIRTARPAAPAPTRAPARPPAPASVAPPRRVPASATSPRLAARPAQPAVYAPRRQAGASAHRASAARPAASQQARRSLPSYRPRRHRLLRWLLPLAAVIVVGYALLAWSLGDKVPAGTTVAGVDIGGQARSRAIATLNQKLAPQAAAPIAVQVAGAADTLDPAQAGLTFSAADTVASLTGSGFSPASVWRHLFGTQRVAPATHADQAKLKAAIAALALKHEVAAKNGTISVATGKVKSTKAVAGSQLDQAAAAAQVAQNWLTASGPLKLTTVAVQPAVTNHALATAKSQIAEPLLSGPVEVQVSGSQGASQVELPVAALAQAATIAPGADGQLKLAFDEAALQKAVDSRVPDGLIVPAADAHFVFKDGKPVIEGGAQGEDLDYQTLIPQLEAAAVKIGTDQRQVRSPLVQTQPATTAAGLQAMGVKEVVSSFTTQAYADAGRSANLRLAAKKVTGSLVAPGATFDLQATLGTVDQAHGWHEAGVVIGIQQTEGYGGGLSQFSTTLYNASHLAGYVDVEHQPHSTYFTRYPECREATLWEGVIDNKFKNDTPYGALLRAWLDSGLTLHVQIWSTKYFTVKSKIYPRTDIVKPKTIVQKASPTCTEQPMGQPGFLSKETRWVYLNGKLQEKKTWTWRYQPTNKYVCK